MGLAGGIAAQPAPDVLLIRGGVRNDEVGSSPGYQLYATEKFAERGGIRASIML